jgi:pantetheine-phosphate adenylyltransferase
MKAVVPGSFDPIHHGHLDVITRAAALFDEVIVGVGGNGDKGAFLSREERLGLVAEAVAGMPNVGVVPLEGLLVDFCRAHGAKVVVKGMRSATDYDYEAQMAQLNRSMTGLDSVLLATAPQWAYLSSSRIREIAALGGGITDFVSAPVAKAIDTVLARRKGASNRV